MRDACREAAKAWATTGLEAESVGSALSLPTVLILNSLINPLGWGYSSAILIGNICSVALTGWILVPGAQKIYSDWFNGRLPPRGEKLALLSILALILLSWSISQTLSG